MPQWLADILADIRANYAKVFGLKEDTPKCPPYTGPGSLRGVSVDYNWIKVDYGKAFKALAEAGCNATSIEFFMWSGTYDVAKGLSPLKDPYKRAIDAARKHGGILFNSLTNDNQGSGKYGDRRKRLENYSTLVYDALDFCISLGSEGQWIQPVAETSSAWARTFEEVAIDRINASGCVSVYNRGSRPTSPSQGAKRNAYHPFRTSDVGTADDIVVTDTGTILGQLQDGGIYGKTINDTAAGNYAETVRKAGNRDLLIYTFTGLSEFDVGAAEAVGKAWK